MLKNRTRTVLVCSVRTQIGPFPPPPTCFLKERATQKRISSNKRRKGYLHGNKDKEKKKKIGKPVQRKINQKKEMERHDEKKPKA